MNSKDQNMQQENKTQHERSDRTSIDANELERYTREHWVQDLSVYERVSFFGLAITSAYHIGMWCFDSAFHLFSTTADDAETLERFLKTSGCEKALSERDGNMDKPIILTDPAGMTWVAENAFDAGNPTLIILMGPFFRSTLSELDIRRRVAAMDMLLEYKSALLKVFDRVPVVTISSLDSYIRLMHYMMTQQSMTHGQYEYLDLSEETSRTEEKTSEKKDPVPDERNEQYSSRTLMKYEEQFLDTIRNGSPANPDPLDFFPAGSLYAERSGNELRDEKDTDLILCALCSRAAIEGGMTPDSAKKVEFSYLNKIESARSQGQLRELIRSMSAEFSEGVRRSKEEEGISPVIRHAIDYIRLNITKPMDTDTIAKEVGYTSYYFTRRFREETGMKLSEFINKEKVEFARRELIYSDTEIEELVLILHFSSRSYFSRVFRVFTGTSPAEYRAKNRGRTPAEDAR